MENFEKYLHNDKCLNVIVFTAADIDNAMHAVKCNKAAGPDNLTVEHLMNAGGRVPFLLSKLFNSCLVHGFVPHKFGTSLIVPVSKGNASKLIVFEGYRLVSLISIVFKVFEMCLFERMSRAILDDDLQFRFTSGTGNQRALLLLSTVVDYFMKEAVMFIVLG